MVPDLVQRKRKFFVVLFVLFFYNFTATVPVPNNHRRKKNEPFSMKK